MILSCSALRGPDEGWRSSHALTQMARRLLCSGPLRAVWQPRPLVAPAFHCRSCVGVTRSTAWATTRPWRKQSRLREHFSSSASNYDQQISMVTANEVRQWLASNLESVDLSKTSERMVIQQMVSELGDGASQHRAVAKEEIAAYINNLAEEPAPGGTAPAAEAAAEADEDDDDFEEPTGSKSKRKANTASEGKPAKKGKLAAEPVAGTEDVEAPEEVPFNLSNNRKADVTDFKGTYYCNIREYYEKDGKQLPGKKGISLPQEQFLKLEQHAQELTEALRDQNDSFSVALSNKRKACISSFSKRWGVDIREWYEKDGEEKPGKKGIFLNPEQWHILAKGMHKLADAFP